ncbi:unnamed protein product [Penicillium salamii]|nr:unnamed protein product [Penicillium salamii]CAG8357047.1 unnamed protein product [Penicillium salamii]
MRYQTLWHPEHKVPIVNGRYQDPRTGEIRQNTRTDTFLGPPFVHVTWFNNIANSTFRSIGATLAAPIDDVLVSIANHVKENIYSITSINATLYSVTVVCSTEKTDVEIGDAIQHMQQHLNKDVVIPEEELAALREWTESKESIENALPEESDGRNASRCEEAQIQ